MLKFAADENFNNTILRGLNRRKPDLDILRVQDAGLSGAPDTEVLEWAAKEGRILLTHDVSTMTKYAYERIAAGKPMPGVIEADITASIGEVIENILIMDELSLEGEWENKIIYLP